MSLGSLEGLCSRKTIRTSVLDYELTNSQET